MENVLRFGVEENEFPECLKDLDDFVSCKNIRVDSIYFWLKLIWPGKLNLLVYPINTTTGTNATWQKHLEDNFLHIFPQEMVVKRVPTDYHAVPLDSFHFKFYERMLPPVENSVLFLLSPFHMQCWLILLMSFIFLKIFINVFKNVKLFQEIHHHCFSIDCLRRADAVLRVFITCLYASQLKAILTSPTARYGFKSLQELAEKIEHHDYKIYIETNNSFRFRLLNDTEMEKPEEFKIIQKLVQQKQALKIVENVTELCKIITIQPGALFLSYDRLVEMECSRYCFWEYEITELPPLMLAFYASKNITAERNGSMLVDAFNMYRLNMLKMRRLVADCSSVKRTKTSIYISMKSLLIPAYAFVVEILFCIFSLLMEIFVKKLMFSADDVKIFSFSKN